MFNQYLDKIPNAITDTKYPFDLGIAGQVRIGILFGDNPYKIISERNPYRFGL